LEQTKKKPETMSNSVADLQRQKANLHDVTTHEWRRTAGDIRSDARTLAHLRDTLLPACDRIFNFLRDGYATYKAEACEDTASNYRSIRQDVEADVRLRADPAWLEMRTRHDEYFADLVQVGIRFRSRKELAARALAAAAVAELEADAVRQPPSPPPPSSTTPPQPLQTTRICRLL
jgi:BMFP domain-containing protein YqiC